MRIFGFELRSYPQWIAFFGAVLLVAGGLCGVQWVVFTEGSAPKWLGTIVFGTGMIELAAIFLSGLGVVVVLIAWIVHSIGSAANEQFGNKDQTQRLFEKEDEGKDGDEK